MTTPDITAAMQAAMDGENRRRRLASQAPGSGALLGLPQPPSGAGIGISDADMPVMGEGYGGPSIAPVPGGTGAPSYADDLVGGIGFQGGRSEPAVRHVSDIGDGRLLIEPYTRWQQHRGGSRFPAGAVAVAVGSAGGQAAAPLRPFPGRARVVTSEPRRGTEPPGPGDGPGGSTQENRSRVLIV